MSDVAASLGPGKLVVLPPAVASAEGIEVAVGLSRWWVRQLEQAGRHSFWFLLGVPDTVNPRELQVFDTWPEQQVAELLVAGLQARFGLAPEFVAMATRSKIDVRLFEVTGEGRVQAIGDWSFDGDNLRVPAFAFEVADAVARCLGTKLVASTWQDAFGTGDEFGSMCFLAALGSVSLLEDRFATNADTMLKTIMATYRAAPTMQAGIDLMEDALRAMVKGLGANDLELAAVLKHSREALGRSPAQWRGLVERVRSASPA